MADDEIPAFEEPPRYSVPFGVFLALEAFQSSATAAEGANAWHHLIDAYRMLYGPDADPSALSMDELIASIQLAIAAGVPDPPPPEAPKDEPAPSPPPPRSVAEAAGYPNVPGWRPSATPRPGPDAVIHTTVPPPPPPPGRLSDDDRDFLTRRITEAGAMVVALCARDDAVASLAVLVVLGLVIVDLVEMYRQRRARR